MTQSQPTPAGAPMISFSNVQKSYGSVPALIDISADVARGEVVVVCGPSGSGKSTLIRTVNRLEEIQSGSIRFDGQEVHGALRGKQLNRLRSRIGFVFQSFNLFPHLSALDNVMLSPVKINGIPRDVARETAMRLLDRVGLSAKVRSYPGAAFRRPAAARRNRTGARHGAACNAV